jgi:hypothetical protein
LIIPNLHRIKVERSRYPLTSFSGLPFLVELADHLGVCKTVNRIPGLQERRRDHMPSDYLMSLVCMLSGGGDTLDEVELIRQDPGLKKLFGTTLPAPNSVGEFLRRFDRSAAYDLSLISSSLALESLQRLPLSEVTLDFDSTLIESKKEEAAKSYAGYTAYNPLLVWIAEANVWLTGVFRPGNASPQSHLVSLLKRCRRLLPEGLRVRVRSDSAGYQIKFVKQCHRSGYLFTVTADQDAAVQASIAAIPRSAWRLVKTKKDVYLLAETVHAIGNHEKTLPAFRLIVTRKITGQIELFESPLVHRAILSNACEDWSAEQVLDFHNKRGTMEKAIEVLKNDTGLGQLPCGKLLANTAYFQTTLLTYNLLQIFKLVALPLDWRHFGWTKLRYRLLGQAALVVCHAREMIVKLARDYLYYPIFEQARWAIVGLASTAYRLPTTLPLICPRHPSVLSSIN